ncbi:glutamyl-tRNA amidotransferase [Diplogelasinospora grovesii]|uniref:Glutamyl-tRNA amidotransferase n=1 Tax=Diplogelasinospora grovesii TaxID=303347 RepID=A0AAN6N5L9_9PEZI|nr:glutamyl-tRNA amidotransferase [Diplogelasinospora grovesii]
MSFSTFFSIMTLVSLGRSGPDSQKPGSETTLVAVDTDGIYVASPSNGAHYLIEPQALPFPRLQSVYFDACSDDRPSAQLPNLPDLQFRPAAVISVETPADVGNFLRSKVLAFLGDTEFESHFLGVLVLAVPWDSSRLRPFWSDIQAVLAEFHCNSLLISPPRAFLGLPEGPYFTKDRCLHRAWRLFPDVYEVFQLPTVQVANSDKFKAITYMRDGKLMVPVPSRLHFQKTPEKPLNGLRVTLKDIIDLKGVRTTGQCRAYEKLYGPRTETAAIASRLIELGAVIIGKTKCTQFASSDQPTADWVDYHCPWNPRGDGYLSPRGSSTGTCVALAGYDWVDAGVGSDRGGSIRGPAAVMGLFALRPTQTPKNMHGILPIIRNIDAPGVVCRGAELFHELSVCLFETRALAAPLPTKLLYPLDYWQQWPDNSAKAAMEGSVRALEGFLGIKRSIVNLADLWLEHDPAGNGLPLDSFLQDTFMNLLWKGYYDSLLGFRRDFETKYGVKPYVHPVIQYCWKRGSQVSARDEEAAQQQKAAYAGWLSGRVLDGDGFKTIMVFPVGDLRPFYRDEYRKAPDDQPASYDWMQREDHQSSLAGVPCIVVPVDQVSHPSKITGDKQLLPVAVSLMSGVGTDSALTRLVRDMARQSFFKEKVNVGKDAFAVEPES